MTEQNLTLPSSLRQGLDMGDERAESAVVLMTTKNAVAVIAMADKVRERARQAVNRLKEKDIQVVMITGDAEAVARTVAEDLGIERYYVRVLPEDKVSIIAQSRGRTTGF